MGTCPPPEFCHRSPETLDGNSSQTCPDVDAILTSLVGCRYMLGLLRASGRLPGTAQGPLRGLSGASGGLLGAPRSLLVAVLDHLGPP